MLMPGRNDRPSLSTAAHRLHQHADTPQGTIAVAYWPQQHACTT